MNLSELMLMVFVIAFSALPVYWMFRVANTRNRVLKKALAEVINQEKLLLKPEVWSNKLIALDKDRKLYYITTDENNQVKLKEILDLNDLKECQLRINKKEVFKNDDAGKMEIRHIDMNFFMNGKKQMKSIVLYDNAEDDILDHGYHLQVGKRWMRLIQEQLKSLSLQEQQPVIAPLQKQPTLTAYQEQPRLSA